MSDEVNYLVLENITVLPRRLMYPTGAYKDGKPGEKILVDYTGQSPSFDPKIWKEHPYVESDWVEEVKE